MKIASVLPFLLWSSSVTAHVYEVLEGSHFNDLILDMPMATRAASVIAFWNDTKECVQAVKDLDFTQNGVPPVEHLMLTRYEMSNVRDRVWYEFEPHLDLATRLGIYDYLASQKNSRPPPCPLLVFLPAEYSQAMGEWYLNEPPTTGIKFWDGARPWREWIWELLKLQIKLVNPYPRQVQISITPAASNPFATADVSSEGEQVMEQTVTLSGLTSHVSVSAFVGDSIKIVVPKHDESYTIPPGTTKIMVQQGHYDKLVLNIGPWHAVTSQQVHGRHSTTCMTHMRNLVIPPKLPKFTPIGFKKIKMPDRLRDEIQGFYMRMYSDKLTEEWWDSVGTQLNFIDVKTQLVSLDHDFELRDWMANDLIKPILEEWSGKKLEFTSFYGVREYYDGSVLRNHVDRVDTHVISAILQVAQSGVEEDWELEVFGWDNKRHQVVLEPGEMALYEGAALIHGRPKPFNGTKFANCFCHFKPVDYTFSAGKVFADQSAPNRGTLHLNTFGNY